MNNVERKIYFVLMVILLIIAFGLGYYTFWCRYVRSDALQKVEIPVSDELALPAEEIRAKNIDDTRRYVGYVMPIHEVFIQPFINGYLQKINVVGGQNVQHGELLAVIDQRPYKAALASAYAAELKTAATLENAQIYYNRLINAGKSVSQTELDNARTQLLTAQAENEQAHADYMSAQINFDYTIIRAPIDGRVGQVALTRGNYVSPDSGALFSIVQEDPIRVVFSLTEKEYLNHSNQANLFEGDEISLELADGRIFSERGKFAYTDNATDKATDSIAVYADFANPKRRLTPNAFVTVRLTRHLTNHAAILKNLVTLTPQGDFVYVIRDAQVRKIPVRIVASEADFFVVENTFLKGDALITVPMTDDDIGRKARAVLKPEISSTKGEE